MTHHPTPGQTVGPFFGFALPYAGDSELVPPTHPRAVRLHGHVYDGHGDPVPDALLEIWQADEEGTVPQAPGSLRRDGWTFTGFGRAATDSAGHYSFTTLRPGAPYVALVVFARGLLDRLFTRIYLPEHAEDPFVQGIPEGRGSTLVARRDEHGYVFDVHLQGNEETVFLDFEAR